MAEATRSLWLKEALADGREDQPELVGDVRADVCIVGGGYLGLWTALRLKEHESSLDVVVLEADTCGAGASGRNGGFVLSWWAKFGTLKKLCATDEALALARASADAVREIGDFCAREGIDAHYSPNGWLWTASSRAQIGVWRPLIEQLRRAGAEPFIELEAAEVARRAGTDMHLAGVLEPTGATVQPAILARGLRQVALERGVRIFEHSAMTSLDRSRPPRVHVNRGSVLADRVVIAMNAWAARIRELRGRLVVIASDLVATEPLPGRLEEIGIEKGLAISDSRMLLNYYRTTRDGRIAFGKAGGALAFAGRVNSTFEGSTPRAADLIVSFRSLYPALADLEVPAGWTGPVDRSVHGLPFFERLGGREDIICGVGFSGNGVGPTHLGGRILAAMALDRADEWSFAIRALNMTGRFPPEPIRYLGGLAIRSAAMRKDRAEDLNRLPNRLTLSLTALAPPGLNPVTGRRPGSSADTRKSKDQHRAPKEAPRWHR